MKISRILFAGLAGVLAHSAALAVVLPVQQDTSLSSTGALTVLAGKSATLTVTTSKTALVKFDLTKLPPGVTYASFRNARLRVYTPKVTKAGDLQVYFVTSAWTETNAGAGPTKCCLVGLVPSAEVVSRKFLVADVSAAVGAWLTGNPNNGLAIVGAAGASVSLSSKEGSSTGYPAELEIDFDPNVLATGNTSLAGAVGIGTSDPQDSILDVEGDTHINDYTIFLRGGADRNHGVGWYGGGKSFAGAEPDGPVLFGFSSGALGTTGAGEHLALSWDTGGNVGISGNVNASGNVKSAGRLALGSGTGTSEGLDRPDGLVIRRITSRNQAANQVIARNNQGTLERDGSYGGIRLRYNANPGRITIVATGMTAAGATVNFYQFLDGPVSAGTAQIFTDAQGVVFFRCQFGDVFDMNQEHTEVSISRTAGDFYWAGFVTSTFNQ